MPQSSPSRNIDGRRRRQQAASCGENGLVAIGKWSHKYAQTARARGAHAGRPASAFKLIARFTRDALLPHMLYECDGAPETREHESHQLSIVILTLLVRTQLDPACYGIRYEAVAERDQHGDVARPAARDGPCPFRLGHADDDQADGGHEGEQRGPASGKVGMARPVPRFLGSIARPRPSTEDEVLRDHDRQERRDPIAYEAWIKLHPSELS